MLPINTDDWNDWWMFRLFQNLLGYSTIAIPGALIIHYVKKTKYLETTDYVCLKKYIRIFVYGQEEEKLDIECGESVSTTPVPEVTRYRKAFEWLLCFCGLQASYLTWGVLQEKIMTQEYRNSSGDVQKFTDSQFLVFVNRVLAFIFAGTCVMVFKHPTHTAPLYKYSYCSFSNIMSSWCQYEALKYVSFPTQVLAKASKIIPVMLMGKIISRKSYKYYEYVTALMISVGMTMFLWSQGNNQGRVTSTTMSGVIILISYMISDSFTSNWQDVLFKRYKMSSVQMMCGVNFFSCLFTSVSLLQQGSFSKSILFLIKFSAFFGDCLVLSVCSAVGQLCIFYTIYRFGPVVFVIMMTVRQALAILLSCLIYHHSVSLSGVVGIVLVFVAISLRMCFNQKSKSRATPKLLNSVSNDQKV